MVANSRYYARTIIYSLFSAAVLLGTAVQADDMVVFERDADGNISTSIEVIGDGLQAVCKTQYDLFSKPQAIFPSEFTPQLVVLSDGAFSWDTMPACSADPVTICSTNCGGPYGHEDFDATWGPLTAPPGLTVTFGWKPNGCTSTSGQLEFYIVPNACGGSGTLVHTVTGNLGFDWDNFTMSEDIDLSGILRPGETYYLRVVEVVEDTICGGVDYHISGFGVFAPNIDPFCDFNSDGFFDVDDVLLFISSCSQ
jgi:hypothetical protein